MNRGLRLDLEIRQQSEQDWKFGGFSQPCIFAVPHLSSTRA
jgi:hypothetical protein